MYFKYLTVLQTSSWLKLNGILLPKENNKISAVLFFRAILGLRYFSVLRYR